MLSHCNLMYLVATSGKVEDLISATAKASNLTCTLNMLAQYNWFSLLNLQIQMSLICCPHLEINGIKNFWAKISRLGIIS